MTAGTGPIGEGGKQGFDSAYQELIDSGRLQTQMDAYQPPEPRPQAEPPAWLDWLSGTGPFWEALGWTLAAIFVAALAFFVGRYLYRRYRDRAAPAEEEEDADWRPEEAAARSLLGEADALAREGRFVEAVHLLLFRSLEHIEERLPDFLRPALTSRDIADAEALPPPARGAFAAIAGIVERGFFAARPVDESGWTEARAAYERFAFGESWR